jgi:hypothetical protein
MSGLTAMASESSKIWSGVRGTSATPRSQACDDVTSFSRKRRNSDRGCKDDSCRERQNVGRCTNNGHPKTFTADTSESRSANTDSNQSTGVDPPSSCA